MALSDAEVVRLRERYAAGARQVDLATEFGIAQTAVSAIVTGRTRVAAGGPLAARPDRHAPRPAPASSRKVLSPDQIEQVRRRVAAGEKRTQIAAARDYGTSQQVISQIVRRVTYTDVT